MDFKENASRLDQARRWLDDRQLLPGVVEDARALRFLSNAAVALGLGTIVSWVLHSRFDSPGANAVLHLIAIGLVASLYWVRKLRAARFELAESVLFAVITYTAVFLPCSLYLFDMQSDFALGQLAVCLYFVIFLYPLRPALVSIAVGTLAALLVATLAWLFSDRLFVGPDANLVLLLFAPAWTIMRAHADRTTKDKVFAVKVTTDTIAHEMRTPMASIEMSCVGLKQNFSRFLAKTLGPTHEDNTYVQTSVRSMFKAISRIEDEAQRMQSNFNLLLQNASAPKAIPPDTTLVPSMAGEVKKFVSSYPFYDGADLENINLKVVADFPVWVSPGMLEHVITNLLKNALHSIQKARKGNIVIEVAGDAGSGFNILRFRDTGSGMPKATLNRVFTPFYTTRTNGTGLGLYFCRKVLGLFGAEITADSVDGEFAEFTIRFPNVEHRIQHVATLPPDHDHPG